MSARLPSSLVGLLVLALCACSKVSEPAPGPTPAKPAALPAASAPSAPSSTAGNPGDPGWRGGLHGSPDEFKSPPHPKSDNATEISAWDLLIAYQGALNAGPSVTRSKAEAESLAIHLSEQARAGADFKELVRKYSDDPISKANLGDLGKFKRADKSKAFSDAAFDLMKMEVTPLPIEAPDGFHLIRRTG